MFNAGCAHVATSKKRNRPSVYNAFFISKNLPAPCVNRTKRTVYGVGCIYKMRIRRWIRSTAQAEGATLCTRARSSEGNDPGLRTTDQPQSGLDVPQPTRRIAEALEVGRTRLVGEREDEVAHRLAAVLPVTLGLPMAQRHVRAGTLRGVYCPKRRPRLRLVNPDLADRSGQAADMATKRKPDYRPRKSARRFCTAVHSSTVTAPRRRSKRETDTDCTC